MNADPVYVHTDRTGNTVVRAHPPIPWPEMEDALHAAHPERFPRRAFRVLQGELFYVLCCAEHGPECCDHDVVLAGRDEACGPDETGVYLNVEDLPRESLRAAALDLMEEAGA